MIKKKKKKKKKQYYSILNGACSLCGLVKEISREPHEFESDWIRNVAQIDYNNCERCKSVEFSQIQVDWISDVVASLAKPLEDRISDLERRLERLSDI